MLWQIESRGLETTADKEQSIEELMAKLQGMPGMGNTKIYGKDDIARMAEMYKNYDAKADEKKKSDQKKEL